MFRWHATMSVLAALAAAGPALADDAQITLVVSREFNSVTGRWGGQQIRVNNKFVGEVPNGKRLRFAVPLNSGGKYEINASTWTGWGGASKSFVAAGGDEIFVRTGIDTVMGNDIRSIHRFSQGKATLRVVAPAGVSLSINGEPEQDLKSGDISPVERTTTNKFLRLAIRANSGGRREEFLVFARPKHVHLLSFGEPAGDRAAGLLASVQFLTQVRACVVSHLGVEVDDLAESLDQLVKDLNALRTDHVRPELLKLRDETVAYFAKLNEMSKGVGVGAIAKDLLVSALLCGLEAFANQQMPTQSEALGKSVYALLEAGYSQYSMNGEIKALTGAQRSAEEAVEAGLLDELRRLPQLRDHEYARQILLGKDLMGSWSYQVKYPDQPFYNDCYKFGPDGSLEEVVVRGEEIRRNRGTYETDGFRTTIRWDDGEVESGTIEEVDPDRLRYTILDHSADPKQKGMQLHFGRISGGEGKGTVSIENPLNGKVTCATRWAGEDGQWTSWKNQVLDSGTTTRFSYRGGFHFEVRYDSSFEEGQQLVVKELAVSTQAKEGSSRPPAFAFELDGLKLNLRSSSPEGESIKTKGS